MYAIIEDSGTQIMVRPGDVIEIDPRTDGSEPKGELVFDRVLTVSDEDGKGGTVGTPYLEGASVSAEILGEKKGEKLVSVRYKRRKGMRRKMGHRQQYLTVKIGDISAG
ncbi:MAG: 50S ribosomal protein L21 [Planctomycetaceae bacterium]|nr:50S ribosomal protein L21 [Planctomycetaceae bacterium]